MCFQFPMCLQLLKQEEPLILQVRKQPLWEADCGQPQTGDQAELVLLAPEMRLCSGTVSVCAHRARGLWRR